MSRLFFDDHEIPLKSSSRIWHISQCTIVIRNELSLSQRYIIISSRNRDTLLGMNFFLDVPLITARSCAAKVVLDYFLLYALFNLSSVAFSLVSSIIFTCRPSFQNATLFTLSTSSAHRRLPVCSPVAQIRLSGRSYRERYVPALHGKGT